MPCFTRRRVALSLLIAAPTLLAASAASAALPLVVASQQTLDGIHEYSSITVKTGGRIAVRPVGAGLGWLHLRANAIIVETGGVIDATGSGFQGNDNADGNQPTGTQGAGNVAGGPDMPGTGGANAGDGGLGTGVGCSLINAVSGGTAYAMVGSLNLGSAGGAALVAAPSLPTRGGHGGGRITLEAAVLTIDGAVRADGEPGLNPSGIGSGGGAGGVIQILGGSVAGAGALTVRGGAGGDGKQSGGGGGGGLVLLASATPLAMFTVGIDVEGGQSGACMGPGAGGKGMIVESPGSACVDIDQDGFDAAACGGADCDDADAAIHPAENGVSVTERCDAQDNDCNGVADDDLPEGACPGGRCESGACVPDATGAGGGGGAGPRPDHLEYVGGCAIALGPSVSGARAAGSGGGGSGGLPMAALGAAALAIGVRRRRPSSRKPEAVPNRTGDGSSSALAARSRTICTASTADVEMGPYPKRVGTALDAERGAGQTPRPE